MNEEIIITHDPFAMESRGIISQDGSTQPFSVPSNIQNMAAVITNLAYTKNIYNFKISALQETIEELTSQVNKHEQQVYSKNQIKIEGI